MTHIRQVCEHGSIHAECRCPAPNKTIERIDCPTPDECVAAAKAAPASNVTAAMIDGATTPHAVLTATHAERFGDHGPVLTIAGLGITVVGLNSFDDDGTEKHAVALIAIETVDMATGKTETVSLMQDVRPFLAMLDHAKECAREDIAAMHAAGF